MSFSSDLKSAVLMTLLTLPSVGIASENLSSVSSFDHAPKTETRLPKDPQKFQPSRAPRAAQTMYFQDRLLTLADYYMNMTYVPYIWGGGSIGDKDVCLACRSCVLQNKVPLQRRLQSCSACRRCGMDCSHFVYRLYQEAGLNYAYASSWELSRQNGKGLLKHYNLIDIGRDLALAQPGDLLIFRKHIMMLSGVISPSRGDFVHITRFRPGDASKLGGFRWDKDKDILNYRGKLVRILRHKRFFDDPENFTFKNPLKNAFEVLIAGLWS